MMSDEAAPYIKAIKGVIPPTGGNLPVRMEVRDMKKNHPKMWKLFILGLHEFQNRGSKDDPLSWFQIAGIHGMPYQRWPDQDWNKHMEPFKGEKTRGFCTHTSILFLPWHRPYLALFEYELYSIIQGIVKGSDFKDDPEYAAEAKVFRLPYWDWADPTRDIFPEQARQDTAASKLYDGCSLTHNPLASYVFPEGTEDKYKVMNYPRTVRYATKEYVEGVVSKPDEKRQEEKLQKQHDKRFTEGMIPVELYKLMKDKGRNVTERMNFILTSYDQYRPMSSNKLADSNKDNFVNYGSFEDVHNMIHNFTGSGYENLWGETPSDGQMADIRYAAFDPIFWLHHVNIDRLWAMWQSLHPGTSFDATKNEDKDERKPDDPNANAGGTWVHGINAIEDINTTLEPWFKDSKCDFMTAKECEFTHEFGYTYPELVDNPTKEELIKRINRVYPDCSLANLALNRDGSASRAVEDVKKRAILHKAVDKATTPGAPPSYSSPEVPHQAQQVEIPQEREVTDLVTNSEYSEWLFNIRARKHALGGRYTVHVFIGQPDDENPRGYILSPTHVSLFSPFGQGGDTSCGKCQKDQAAGVMITGQIPLTIGLVERYLAGQLRSLLDVDVIPFLQEYLHWRVVDGDSRLVENQSLVNDLIVAVVKNRVDLSTGMPVYDASVEPVPAITTKADTENGRTGRGNGTGYVGPASS